MLLYHRLAKDTGLGEIIMRKACLSFDCGRNGLTTYRRNLSLQETVVLLHWNIIDTR
jgi:hypothetical protein